MTRVVADTGPLHYLVLTGDSALLPCLFEHVLIPDLVQAELAHARAPEAVRAWIAAPPPWLTIRSVDEMSTEEADLASLDVGERAAVVLAQRPRPICC